MHPLPTRQPADASDATDASRCPYQRMAAEGAARPCAMPTTAIPTTALPTTALPTPPARPAAPAGTLLLVGVDHHTAPVALRERFHHGGELSAMLDDLRRLGVAGAVVLFTCNRFEVYATVGTAGSEAIVDYLAARCGMATPELLPSLYRSEGRDAALHLMRVASGLESIVLGEPQVLGQVADALAYAQANGAAGTTLARLFTSAVRAGKRARTETAIGRHTLSISHAAVLLLKSSVDLAAARVVVIGAGEMAGLAVAALHVHGARDVRVVNRTAGRAAALAGKFESAKSESAKFGSAKFGVAAAPWAALPALLRDCDAVIAATSSPAPIVTAGLLADRPAGRPLELIDLSVPRNVEDACRGVAGVRLHDVDALEAVVESHRACRQREASRVEALLDEELADYLDWMHSRKVTPLISDLRRRASDVVEAEVEQTLRRLPNLDEASRAVVAQMAHRIVGKLLHSPTVALKSRDAATGEFAHVARRLFALDASGVPAAAAEHAATAPEHADGVAGGGRRDVG